MATVAGPHYRSGVIFGRVVFSGAELSDSVLGDATQPGQVSRQRPLRLCSQAALHATRSGRIRFVLTGFEFYRKTGFGLHVQIFWTVWFRRGCRSNECYDITVPPNVSAKTFKLYSHVPNNVLYGKLQIAQYLQQDYTTIY